jgi:hypothetical protein
MLLLPPSPLVIHWICRSGDSAQNSGTLVSLIAGQVTDQMLARWLLLPVTAVNNSAMAQLQQYSLNGGVELVSARKRLCCAFGCRHSNPRAFVPTPNFSGTVSV